MAKSFRCIFILNIFGLFTEKHKLAEVMFNYFDHNYNGRIEKEELWEMQLRESMDKISSLCTLLDIVTFDELGVKDGMLSPDEFIQAFGKLHEYI